MAIPLERVNTGFDLTVALGKGITIPTRRTRVSCCPRAVSGHAAALPRSVMNSRVASFD